MSAIYLFKVKPARLPRERLTAVSEALEFKASVMETEEALAINADTATLIYSQPGSRFGGLLVYKDLSRSIAEPVDKVVDPGEAKQWVDTFLRRFELAPRETKDDRIRLDFELITRQPEAVTFDGKERIHHKIKTEIASKSALNGVPVVGPRAKVRVTFKDSPGRPIAIHRGLWEDIDIYEERELIREHTIVATLKERLATRGKAASHSQLVDIRLAYFAHEYEGGPDILRPYYFINMEFPSGKMGQVGDIPGLRKAFWLPAYR